MEETGWHDMKSAPRDGSTVRLKCSDGVERSGKHHGGDMFEVAPGAYVVGKPSDTAIAAIGWKPA